MMILDYRSSGLSTLVGDGEIGLEGDELFRIHQLALPVCSVGSYTVIGARRGWYPRVISEMQVVAIEKMEAKGLRRRGKRKKDIPMPSNN